MTILKQVLLSLVFLAQISAFASPEESCDQLLGVKKATGKTGVLFQNNEILQLGLTGEFERIRKANSGGNWTGEDRSDENFWSQGTLVNLADSKRSFKVRVRARGMSSADDLDFPKLRVEIDADETLQNTVFKGARKFRINTHGSSEPRSKHTAMGRLHDERAPFREALAYEIAQAMELPAPRIRRAQIQYLDTRTKKTFTHQALILETDKKIAKRLGGTPSVRFPELNKIPTRLGALFHIFNTLIGNDDIGLKLKNEPALGSENYRPLFNTTVFEDGTGRQFPIVYDFDLATLVTDWDGRHVTSGLPEFNAPDHRVESMVLRLARLRSRLSQSEYDQAIADFRSKREAISEAISSSVVDEEGRGLAFAHLAAFEEAIRVVSRYSMLVKEGVRFHASEALADGDDLLRPFPLSDLPGTLRPGTMVAVLEKKAKVVKIAIVDMNYHLIDYSQRVGYIRAKDLVLGCDLPEKLQGQIDERDLLGPY